MDISIIIPSYNNEKLLEKNLPKVISAIRDYSLGKIEIIISDDASNDNSSIVAESFINSIKVKNIIGKVIKNNNRKNGGFSKNVNRGANAATGEILVLLNTDVVPHKNFLMPLIKHFNNSKIFAVGCMDESLENDKIVLRGRGIGKWEKGFLFHNAGSLDNTNTLWVSGGSGAFRKSIWDKLGGLNEIFNPFYWEDIDLSYRAQKAGYEVIFEKESIVMHEHSKGPIKTFFKPYNIQKVVYRNQFIFVWVNITDKKLLLNHFIWLPYHLVNAIKSNDKAFIVGFLTALILLPQIYKYKKNMEKLFVISDEDILKRFSK